jgi:hypothetical protein
MSPPWAASSHLQPLRPTRLALFVVFALLGASQALAQDTRPLLLFRDEKPADAERWRERLERRLGPLQVRDAEQVDRAQGVSSERLLPLHRIETLLASAREQAAALLEDQALSSLAEAAGIGQQLGDVPGAAAWNAEIQLQLGITAAQAGLDELAETAFRMAATLDRSRRLLEAEAAPLVVERYERVAREVAMAPRGQLQVRVMAKDALVYLDDAPQGAAPVRIQAPVGRHLLRVEAPGHRAYGAFIDLLEGQRSPLTVQPSPEPALEQARLLATAGKVGDYPALARALDSLRGAGAGPRSVWVLEVASRTHKALLVRCDAGGCGASVRLTSPELPELSSPAPHASLTREALARDRAWLGQKQLEKSDRAQATPLWRRWYLWGSVVAVIATGSVLALALNANRTPAARLRVVVQPGDVGQ